MAANDMTLKKTARNRRPSGKRPRIYKQEDNKVYNEVQVETERKSDDTSKATREATARRPRPKYCVSKSRQKRNKIGGNEYIRKTKRETRDGRSEREKDGRMRDVEGQNQ